jgi:uncharacterized protein
MNFASKLPAALLVGLVLTGMAQADERELLAGKIVVLQDASSENIGRAMASQTAQQVLQAAEQALGSVPEDKREAVAKDIQGDVRKFYGEVEPLLRARAQKLAPATLTPILMDKYTEDELKQVIAWIESPAFKKYQQVGADMQAALSKAVVDDTRATVEPKLKALEDSLRKRLGTPAAGTTAPAASKPAAKAAPAKK